MLKAILFNDTSYNKHHGCQIVVRQIYALASEAGIEIVKACPMNHDWRRDAELQQAIAEVDLCLVNGEGPLHDDARAAQMLVELAPFCKARKVSCFLINSVWQRNHKLLEAARDFSGIYLRDHYSQRELAEAGVPSQVVPDLTLSLPIPPSSLTRYGILVNDSFYEDKTQESWAAFSQLADERVHYLSIQAAPVLQWGKGFPKFIWKSVRTSVQAWRARIVARLTALPAQIHRKQIKLLRWRFCEPTAQRFLERLSASEGVISGRFHCITLCLLTGTPFLAIGSNTHKIEALVEACQLKNRVFAQYTEALAAREMIAFSAEESMAIERFVRASRAQAQAMFADIQASVAGQRIA